MVLAVVAPGQALASLKFIGSNLLSLSPVLLLSVGIAAAIRASGAQTFVARAFQGRQYRAVVLATLAGALSPLCSCGVVPLIAGLLASGVPLAPVMAFWLASPVMDPAMFVLTAGVIDLEFALAKTLAALGIGLLGGFATMALTGRRPGHEALRVQPAELAMEAAEPARMVGAFWREPGRRAAFAGSAVSQLRMLVPLMAIAFLLESLMLAWLPAQGIAGWLGEQQQGWAIPAAAAAGVPAYLNGMAAVPLVGAMMTLGLDRAVALAFMVAGGVTSIPAATAVWGLVKPRMFALYVGLAFAGSLATAYAYAGWLALAR